MSIGVLYVLPCSQRKNVNKESITISSTKNQDSNEGENSYHFLL